jgi:hypothetical protein
MAPPFPTTALDAGEWSASRTCRSTPVEKASGIDWIGDWVGPRDGLDALLGIEPGPSSTYFVVYRLNSPDFYVAEVPDLISAASHFRTSILLPSDRTVSFV